MGTFETNAAQVCATQLQEALDGVTSLEDWLTIVKEELVLAIEKNDGRAFPIEYADTMMENALTIYNEIARCNGACLVRNTSDDKQSDPT